MEKLTPDVKELLEAYDFKGNLENISKISEGHINDTFVFEFKDTSGNITKYLVQELNTNVFKKPAELMENVVGVTEHIRKKISECGGDPDRESLLVYRAKDGKPFHITQNGKFWRFYNYIANSHSLQEVKNADDFRASAMAFGKFQKMLSDYPIDSLTETIPNFHNTVSRFNDFKAAVSENLSGRVGTCREEIEFIFERENDCGVLTKLIDTGELPLRVTHNDTKLNNVMFDDDTNEGICVVDLDTVMPGLSLYDFGDSIRFGASTAAEDEKDLDKVHFSKEYFAAYADGYLSTAGKSLTANEIKYLPFSAKLITLECGMRFLGDYINGDTYFKTEYPQHNLVRARTQLKLVKDMEDSMDNMKTIISDICRKYKINL